MILFLHTGFASVHSEMREMKNPDYGNSGLEFGDSKPIRAMGFLVVFLEFNFCKSDETVENVMFWAK